MNLERIDFSVIDDIAFVTLNRVEKINAIDYQMFKDIDSVTKYIGKQKSIRGVILKANGNDFCSGLDVKSVMKSPSTAFKLLFKWFPGNANLAQRVSIAWRKLPVPVIALIQGRCWGGGTQIALGADLRICSSDAQFSIMETKWGLLPDMAGLVGLRDIVPKDQALKLTMTAEVISAQQALDINLITEINESPESRALEILKLIASRSPDAVAASKKSINKSWKSSARALLRRESFYQVRLLLGKNLRIAARRQKSGEDTNYIDRRNW